MYSGVLFVLFIPALCSGAFLFGGRDQSNWNGLKVTWGINPFNSFQGMPRTKHDAESAGWKNMAPGVACDGHANFRGMRYVKDNDMAVILIYDSNGYIAGIQAGFSKDYTPNQNNYPKPGLRNRPLVLDGSNYFVTAYFIDPATVCTGRTSVQYHSEGTGRGLWIQNGTDPVAHSMKMPLTPDEADRTMWTKGACFYSMGLHYWYNLTKDMNCDNLFPVFLLYNGGQLNAFGWAFAIDLETSNRVEHPAQNSYGHFMKPVPDCLSTQGKLTTMHIYLTDSATADTC